MIEVHTKYTLIKARGARCEVCKCSRWKGSSILTALVMARKDRLNPAYTDDNVILVCRMCFYTEGYSRRRPFKRRTKTEMLAGTPVTLEHLAAMKQEMISKQGQQ